MSDLPPESETYRRPPRFQPAPRNSVQPPDGRRVWYAFLVERCMYDLAFMRCCQLAATAGAYGYQLIQTEYMRTDNARNALVEAFLQVARRPDDTLVMLDVDHAHPKMAVPWLAQHDVEVVAPLMFRRGPPHQACAFGLDAAGNLYHLATEKLAPGLHRMAGGVGTGAIAIQRRALEKLASAAPFWFRYEYIPDVGAPSEDMYFAKLCRAAGVAMWVDTVWESPHISLALVDREVHEAYAADHPQAVGAARALAEIEARAARGPSAGAPAEREPALPDWRALLAQGDANGKQS